MEIPENNLYLKFLINEDIYLVPENNSIDLNEKGSVNTDEYSRIKTVSNKTIIIIDYPDHIKFSDTIKIFLSKILQAVELKLEDVYLFDIGKTNAPEWKFDARNVSECKIIGFLKRIPHPQKNIFNSTKYTINKIQGNVTLLADTLEEIENNKSKKLLLWEILKELYQLE